MRVRTVKRVDFEGVANAVRARVTLDCEHASVVEVPGHFHRMAWETFEVSTRLAMLGSARACAECPDEVAAAPAVVQPVLPPPPPTAAPPPGLRPTSGRPL